MAEILPIRRKTNKQLINQSCSKQCGWSIKGDKTYVSTK